MTLSIDPSTRRWGGQFRADYADEFDHLTGVGGQLILETTSRLGIDTSVQYLRERLPGGGFDHLTFGDCNLVYRFAQSPRAQMRMGIGANWLNDSTRTDLGFNFTYGGDFFPCKPWVLSSAIDWGTLGHAGLFRFRTTAGVILNRFESLRRLRVSRHRHDPGQFPDRRRPRVVLMDRHMRLTVHGPVNHVSGTRRVPSGVPEDPRTTAHGVCRIRFGACMLTTCGPVAQDSDLEHHVIHVALEVVALVQLFQPSRQFPSSRARGTSSRRNTSCTSKSHSAPT